MSPSTMRIPDFVSVLVSDAQLIRRHRDALHRFAFRTIFGLLVVSPTLNGGNGWAQDAGQVAEAFQIPETDDGLPGAGPIRRYDWFQNLWQAKRSGWAKQVQQDQKAVVFLGDSITQGWGDDFGGQFKGMKTANRGISGDTTRGMLIRLQEDVLSLAPSGLVLLMGTNDLEEGATPEVIAGNFMLILDAVRQHDAQMPIVACLVFPSSASKRRPAEMIREINQRYSEIVRNNPQVTLVDTYTLFANESGDAKAEEFPDLLHPNAAGYAKWGAALRPIFATLGMLETEADDFECEAGFTSLFNGKDLTGWCFLATPEKDIERFTRMNQQNKNGLVWAIFEQQMDFDGMAQSSDGRFRAIHDRLVVTTPIEGRRIQALSTVREFPNDFTLKLEFRATPNADSGVFLRGRQLQCRDYLLAGPYKELKSYREGDWNELVVVVKDNVAHCTCNGEVLEAEFTLPATGPIGLEGDRGH
jgi:lysophospholipase L1-like esterase